MAEDARIKLIRDAVDECPTAEAIAYIQGVLDVPYTPPVEAPCDADALRLRVAELERENELLRADTDRYIDELVKKAIVKCRLERDGSRWVIGHLSSSSPSNVLHAAARWDEQ